VLSGIFDEKKQTENSSESEKDQISRTLFLDFSEKSDSSSDCSSVVTYQGTGVGEEAENQGTPATIEDDDASIWSIQVNTSTRDEDEDEDADKVIENEVEEDDDHVYDDNDDEYDEEGEEDETELQLLDELCEGIRKMNVNGENIGAGRFMGRHTRFVYNSDDELVEDNAKFGSEEGSSGALRLKGLPTPKGKHLRFQDEEDQ